MPSINSFECLWVIMPPTGEWTPANRKTARFGTYIPEWTPKKRLGRNFGPLRKKSLYVQRHSKGWPAQPTLTGPSKNAKYCGMLKTYLKKTLHLNGKEGK